MSTFNFINRFFGNNRIASIILAIFLSSSLHAQQTRTVTTDADSGSGSLRYIIANAEEGDTIVFQSGISSIVRPAGATGMSIPVNNLTIAGDSVANIVTLSGDNSAFIFGLTEITLRNLFFQSNSSGGWGGAIHSPGIFAQVVINSEDVAFFSNSSTGPGGAIGTANHLTINNTGFLWFYNNISTSQGGAILASELTLGNNVRFENNTSTGLGGAISCTHLAIGDQATFIGNSALGETVLRGSGGAIYVVSATIGNFATFVNNTTRGSGGAIHAAGGGDVTLGINSTFSGNSSSDGLDIASGGAVSGGSFTFGSGALFNGNSSRSGGNGGSGGALIASDVSLSGNTFFAGNLASRDGGAIWGGNLVLNADVGDIVFSDNRSGVVFTSDGSGGYTASGGIANSIHMGLNAKLEINGVHNIYFDDPISSTLTGPISGNNSLIKSGTGFVQFLGNNRLNTTGFSGTNSVDIQAGVFRLAENAAFDVTGDGNFNVAAGATLAGQGTLIAEAFTIAGTISPDSDRFEIPTFLRRGDAGTTATNYNFFLNDKPTTVSAANAIGTLTFVGNVTLLDDSTLAIDLGANDTGDRIVVVGDATVGAINVDLSHLIAGSHTLLEADTLTYTNGTATVLIGGVDFATAIAGSRFENATFTIGAEGDHFVLTLGGFANNEHRIVNNAGNGNWNVGLTGLGGGVEFNNGDAVTFTGNTGGTIMVDAGGVLVANMNVTGSGNWTFNGGDIATTSLTTIGSPRKLTMSGTGILTLNNISNFSDGVDILSGTLLVGNSAGTTARVGGAVDVASGATLGGHGRIGELVTVRSGGTLSPGSSIGTLTLENGIELVIHRVVHRAQFVRTGESDHTSSYELGSVFASR